MNIREYLERIGLGDMNVSADADGLKRLQRAHLMAVPFENLDIHWGRPIMIDVEKFYSKIVSERRGGFCYELNGLFNELLKSLGFKTRLISARVFNGSAHGPEFDHAAVIVTIDDAEFLADVGFGDFSVFPLRYVTVLEQQDPAGFFVIRRFDDDRMEVAKRAGDGWKSAYIFADIGRQLPEFSQMCDFQQYSPDSHFTKGKICSILTETGRKSLTDSKYIVTAEGERIESEVASEDEFDALLAAEFGIRRIQ